MRYRLFFVYLLSLSLSACITVQAGFGPTATPSAVPSPGATSLPAGTLMVTFVKDGNLQVWDEATRQTRTLIDTGDVVSVTMSDDGQTVAITRRSWVGDVFDGYEQYALWAMDRDDGNPREMITAQDLRQWLDPGEHYSSNFYQLGWVPNSHRLIVSGTKYIVQAEGLSHAIPQGVWLVDTDTGSVTVLAEAEENLRFLPSPDGNQVALMSPGSTGFINTDGSNRRRDVLNYAEVGLAGPLFPTGVWTQDSRAFVMTGSFEQDPEWNINFTIWRIPMDGSSLEALAAVTASHPGSVTFSPDGKSASFLQQSSEVPGWLITALTPEAGPLALPYFGKVASYASLHWSPAGDAYALKDWELLPLCPDATQDSQVCGEPVSLGSRIINSLQWVDSSRFLFEGIEPNALSLGNVNGTITPITTWTEDDILSGWSFYISR